MTWSLLARTGPEQDPTVRGEEKVFQERKNYLEFMICP